MLDALCAELGRDPASITRSLVLPVAYDRPHTTREAIAAATGAGFGHLVLALPPPYPVDVAHWLADEVIPPSS